MSKVFVLDTNKQQLNPVHPGRARTLLSSGRAAVYRRYPFTIILKVAIEVPKVEPLRVKIDPGANTTGMAIVNDNTREVVFAAEIEHRGFSIVERLRDRNTIRRGRRNRKTRYRQPRFKNRTDRPKGWLAPSLQSRISNVITWVQRLRRVCSIQNISYEDVKFDMQAIENPEISGIEYQRGTLAHCEEHEYLLEKWGRKCAYCKIENVPFEMDHMIPRSKGGTDNTANKVLACRPCNVEKGNRYVEDFLKDKPDLLKSIKAQAKTSLKDAAAVNTIRKELYSRLSDLGLPIEEGSGGLTRHNRTIQELPKTHWIDAACVGKSTPETLQVKDVHPLYIKAMGSGNRHIQGIDRYGFPVKVGKDEREEYKNGRLSGKERNRQRKEKIKRKEFIRQKKVGGKFVPRPIRRIGEDKRKTITPRRHKRVQKFQTGDMVRVVFPENCRSKKNCGKVYIGRIAAARASGSFTMKVGRGTISFSYKYCTTVHKHDGYQYAYHRPV